jgi:hypothetical protein
MKLEGPKREEVVGMMRDWEARLDDHILANIRNIHALRTHQAGFFNWYDLHFFSYSLHP